METVVQRQGDRTTITVSGAIGADEVVSTIERFYAGETTVDVLWDLSMAGFEKISSADVRRIAQVTRRHAEKRELGKTALVFSAEEGYGLGRMFGILQDVEDSPVQYRSFRSMDEADAWLSGRSQE
jgi:hypothetical protein